MFKEETFPLLVCSQCSTEFSYDPGRPIRCRDHPQAELKLKNYSRIRFFDGCGVVGIAVPFGPAEMAGISTDTYCKLSYDSDKKYWRWVEGLPTGLVKNVVTEINKNERKYQSLLNRLVCWFGHDSAIWYSPGHPVGVLGPRLDSIVSCTFDVGERIQVSFQPGGNVDLKVMGNIAWPYEHKAELYEMIIGEVFSVAYDVNRGWVWIPKKVEALERYEEEQNKKKEMLRKKVDEDRERELRKKREKEDSALEGARFLFEPKE